MILGAALEKFLRHLFGSPELAAGFLIVNGVILFAAERLRRRGAGLGTAAEMTWRTALVIGLWQSLALIPGISRSGTTMLSVGNGESCAGAAALAGGFVFCANANGTDAKLATNKRANETGRMTMPSNTPATSSPAISPARH